MLGRRLSWIAAAALLLLGAIGLWGVYGTRTVSLDETRIQTVVAKEVGKEFPLKGAPALLVKSVSAKSATVRIRDGQATILVGVEGALRSGKKFGLTAFARGVPRYSAGEFYFEPEKVEVRDFTYENMNLGEALTQLGFRSLANSKIGQLIQSKAQLAEEWATAVAETAVRDVFERRPVFRLKDDARGMLLKSSLEQVTIDNDRIVVVFSLWSLTVFVFMGAAAWSVGALLVIFLIQTSHGRSAAPPAK
jgi:hypothetical protein